MSASVQNLIEYVSTLLVSHPDEVQVTLVEETDADVYELEVAESDIGQVIGRAGKTARALRTIVTATCPDAPRRILVEILE